MTRAKAMLCVVLVLALSVLGLGPARADEPPMGTVTITAVTPARIQPGAGATITIVGKFTNTSASELHWVSAQLWHDSDGLETFDDVDAALDGPDDPSTGTGQEPGQQLRTGEEKLLPGETVDIRVEAPVSTLEAKGDELATVVGIHVLAAPSPTGPRASVGLGRALVPHATSAFEVFDATVVSAPPGQVPGSRRVSEPLRDAITGPLTSELVDSAQGEGVTLLDPAVFIAARTIVDRGNEYSASAQAFVDAALHLRDEGRLWRLPHGHPDLARLAPALRAEVAARSEALVPDELADVPLAALVPDPALAEGFDEVLVPSTTTGRVFRCADDAGVLILDQVRKPEGAPLGTTEVAPWPQVGRVFAGVRGNEALRREMTDGIDTAITPAEVDGLELAAYSAAFTAESESLAFLAGAPVTQFDPSKISLIASPSFVMGERTSEFPATIANHSSVAVRVRVAFDSDNPVRIRVPDTADVVVGPGESQSLRVKPEATANGATTVTAQLETVDGTPLGEPARITITATEFGRVGWIIVIVSGAVVLGGTVWRIRTVRNEQEKGAREPGQ